MKNYSVGLELLISNINNVCVCSSFTSWHIGGSCQRRTSTYNAFILSFELSKWTDDFSTKLNECWIVFKCLIKILQVWSTSILSANSRDNKLKFAIVDFFPVVSISNYLSRNRVLVHEIRKNESSKGSIHSITYVKRSNISSW